jgi:hypothetical protein
MFGSLFRHPQVAEDLRGFLQLAPLGFALAPQLLLAPILGRLAGHALAIALSQVEQAGVATHCPAQLFLNQGLNFSFRHTVFLSLPDIAGVQLEEIIQSYRLQCDLSDDAFDCFLRLDPLTALSDSLGCAENQLTCKSVAGVATKSPTEAG